MVHRQFVLTYNEEVTMQDEQKNHKALTECLQVNYSICQCQEQERSGGVI